VPGDGASPMQGHGKGARGSKEGRGEEGWKDRRHGAVADLATGHRAGQGGCGGLDRKGRGGTPAPRGASIQCRKNV
jgi:hypothetical protein